MKHIIILVSILLSIIGLTQKSVAQYDTTLSYEYSQTLVLPEISPYTIGKKNGGQFILKPNDYQPGQVGWVTPSCGSPFIDSLTSCGPGYYGLDYKKNNNVWTYLDIYIRYFVDIIDSTLSSSTYGYTPDTIWVNQGDSARISVGTNFVDQYWGIVGNVNFFSGNSTVKVPVGSYWVFTNDADNYNSGDTIVVAEICTPVTSSQYINLCAGDTFNIGTHNYTTGGTYVDTLQAVNSCDSIVTTNITLINYPVLTVSPIDTIICAGSTITLHAGGTGTSFNWSTSETTPDISVMTDTSVSIWVSASNAYCTVTDTINITVNPVFSSTNVVEINDGQSYIINGHTYIVTGIYFDTLFTVHGCDSVVITNLTVLTNIVTTSQIGEIPVIYPNPVNDILTIDISTSLNVTTKTKIEIVDLQGRIIKTVYLINNKTTVDVKELIGGIYTLRIYTDKGIVLKKLVKQ